MLRLLQRRLQSAVLVRDAALGNAGHHISDHLFRLELKRQVSD